MKLTKNQSKEKEPWLRSDVISLYGIILTIATLIVGIITTNISFRNSFIEIQKANMIEKSSELPNKTFEFIRSASLAFACNANSYDSSISEAEQDDFKTQFKEYDRLQSKLLDEIQPLIFSYGSENTIEVFNEFYLLLRQKVNESKNSEEDTDEIKDWLPMYKKLPLIASLVKYDVTGEIINPSVIFEVYMPEFSRYKDEFKTETNQNIQEKSLLKKFTWK